MFYVRCELCGAVTRANGSYDPDTNASEITDIPEPWDGGSQVCEHPDTAWIITGEVETDPEDWE
jgi:hypothetical protein